MHPLDKSIHSETRLFILLSLYKNPTQSFGELQKKLHISAGTLSSHLKKLTAVKYIEQEKNFVDDKPQTLIHLKNKGSLALQNYADNILRLFKDHQLDNGGLS